VSSPAAATHADRAAELLAGAGALERELAELTPERRLELTIAGGFSKLNADLHWTAELAIAHALTAIALQLADRRGLGLRDFG